jgi:hypothetical protein
MITLNRKMDRLVSSEYVATSTALIIAAATAVVGAGVSAYGMYQQGQSQKEMAKYNQKIATNNAIASKQQANYDANRIRDRNRRIRSNQATSFLKSGVTLEGSAQDVLYDSSLEGEMDALSAVYKGKVSSRNSLAQGTIFGMEGDAAVNNANIGMISTGVGAVGSAMGNYGAMRNAGMTGTRAPGPRFT